MDNENVVHPILSHIYLYTNSWIVFFPMSVKKIGILIVMEGNPYSAFVRLIIFTLVLPIHGHIFPYFSVT